MGALICYMVEMSVFMTLLYLGYKWLMAGSTLHTFNRFTLLGIIVASALLPLAMPWFSHTPAIEIGELYALPSQDLNAASTPGQAPRRLSDLMPTPQSVGATAIVLLLGGVIFTLCRSIREVCSLVCLIRRSEIIPHGRYRLAISDEAPGPMSWGRYIILRGEDMDEYREMVLTHELAHLNLLHWLDLLLAQTAVIFQWFSPAAHLIKRELKTVHEFQADRCVARSGLDIREYQLMLLKKTVGSSFPTFTDSLNHSHIKLRITMMMKKESSKMRPLTALSLPAISLAALCLLSHPASAGALDDVRDYGDAPALQDCKVNNSPAYAQPAADTAAPDNVRADIPSDTGASGLTDSACPAADTPDETAAQSAPAPAYFVNGKPLEGALTDIDPSQINSMSVIKDDPAYPQGKIMIELKEGNARNVAMAPERIAGYKGGMDALRQFMTDNIRYPQGAKAEKAVRVIVRFTINADGSVADPQIMRSGGEAFDSEALRVVRLTDGQWEPGYTDGAPAATQFHLPVTFKQK